MPMLVHERVGQMHYIDGILSGEVCAVDLISLYFQPDTKKICAQKSHVDLGFNERAM